MTLWLSYALATISVVLTACAQFLLKSGVSTVAARQESLAGPFKSVWLAATTPMIWCGVLTMGVSLLIWMVALSRLEVSRAYPFASLGIVLTILGGRWLFDEPLSLGKILGATLIVVGVVTVSRA